MIFLGWDGILFQFSALLSLWIRRRRTLTAPAWGPPSWNRGPSPASWAPGRAGGSCQWCSRGSESERDADSTWNFDSLSLFDTICNSVQFNQNFWFTSLIELGLGFEEKRCVNGISSIQKLVDIFHKCSAINVMATFRIDKKFNFKFLFFNAV